MGLLTVLPAMKRWWQHCLEPTPQFHLFEIIQFGDCYEFGLPLLNDHYARVTERQFENGEWLYRVDLGAFPLNAWVPEKYIRKT